MLKPCPSRFSLAAWGIISLLVLSFILAACGGAATPAAEESNPEAGTVEEAQVEAEATEEEEVEVVAQNTATTEKVEPTAATTPEEEAAAEPPAPEVAASGPATCAPLDIPVNTLISPVSDEDWVKGPATASVTVVELGDFQ